MSTRFRSGIFTQQESGYKSFSPDPINQSLEFQDPKILSLLEEATRHLAELNAYSRLVPDVDFFIQMHVLKEATTSSQIEGTQTTINEAVLEKDEVAPERKDDWAEVQNYIEAMNSAIKQLKKLPLSIRLLKETHEILMRGARGQHKAPGKIRISQNWIGGSSIKDAFFIPPHHSELAELLSDLEKYWHNDKIEVPHLLRIAISHYQFETIHPFLDGNGRLGRLLITLYLVSKGVLDRPTLYLSDFFSKHKGSYYDSLTVVRASHDLNQWIRFFLTGVSETAQRGKAVFESIIRLREKNTKLISGMGRKAESGLKLLQLLYSKPVITAKQIQGHLSIKHPTANALLRDFEKAKIVRELTGYRRNRMFEFYDYMELFRK